MCWSAGMNFCSSIEADSRSRAERGNEGEPMDEPKKARVHPNRRQVLARFANGFGLLGLASLLADEARADTSKSQDPADPLAVRPPMYPACAKRVIFLFMSGGPSHVDLFDPKPRLARDNGKPLPFAMPHLERTQDGEPAPVPFQVPEVRAGRPRRQRPAAEPREAGRRPLRDPLDGRRQHQPQRRLPPDEHRGADVLAAEPRLVADVRPRQREPRPARLRRHQPEPAGAGAPLWSSASCRPRIRGL